MTTLALTSDEPVILSAQEATLARQSSQIIAGFVNGAECLRLTLTRDNGAQTEMTVPAQALHVIAHVLAEMAKGNPVTLMPLHAELTTHQAAAILHVSRPYLIKLLDTGKIPCRKVGAHRRIRSEDLMAYMEQEKQARREALNALTAEAQRLGLYE